MDPPKNLSIARNENIDYNVELESQLILRLPETPAKALREVLRLGENLKNRLSIQMESDMRHGQVRFDNWELHAKVVDLPTIIESMKTIDRKSIYKTADICQMMICNDEIDPPTKAESPVKHKKKDPLKVDKKYLFPHGITPPTKNVRKRRFRKTLKKKNVEAPEIEKEVKRLIRADNEAVSFTWEVIGEIDKEEEPTPKTESSQSIKQEKIKTKKEKEIIKTLRPKHSSSIQDIFGGNLSDSDLEDESGNNMGDSLLSTYSEEPFGREYSSQLYSSSSIKRQNTPLPMQHISEDITNDRSEIAFKLSILSKQLAEMKEKRLKTEEEITGLQNMTLRQRFQDILKNMNNEISVLEMEYERLTCL